MAITITSKYKPFTYEELVKPLEGYWKKYDEAEEQLDTLSNSVSTLKSVIASLPEGKEKQKYTNLLSTIETNAGSLADSGLTAEVRHSIKNLKNQYAELIPRLDEANKAYKKDLALEQTRINSGEYLMDTGNSVRSYSPVDYLDGNVPSYNAGISKKELGAEVLNIANRYSSRIFRNVNPEKVNRIGQQFIRTIQEQGINADISNIEGNEQFMPILNEIYKSYGINDMNVKDQAAAKDFINRKFWEGLVYKKAEDYEQMRRASAGRVSTSDGITPLPLVDKNGNQLIKIGGRVLTIGGKDNKGNLIVAPLNEKDEQDKRNPSKQDIANNKFNANFKNLVLGYDNYYNDNVYSPDSIHEMDEDAINDPYKIYNAWKTSWQKYGNSKKIDSKYAEDKGKSFDVSNALMTSLVPQQQMEIAYNKSLQNINTDYTSITADDLLGHSKNANDFIGMHIGGNSRGIDEIFGDNHIRLIPIETFMEYLGTDTDTDFSEVDKMRVLKELAATYPANNIIQNAVHDNLSVYDLIIDLDTINSNGGHWNADNIKNKVQNIITKYPNVNLDKLIDTYVTDKNANTKLKKEIQSNLKDWAKEVKDKKGNSNNIPTSTPTSNVNQDNDPVANGAI